MVPSGILLRFFNDDGVIPNNTVLPVLHYIAVFKRNPEKIRDTFHKNKWLNSWVNGVFNYHHYHSNCHEALGIISGSARLKIGGEYGEEIEVHSGDVIVLPAGTGHKKLAAASNFKVVGAYPNGMSYNLKIGEAEDREKDLCEIKKVPLPELDPVYGEHGPLIYEWGILKA